MRASGLHLCLAPITGILLGCAQGRGRLPNTRALGKPIRSGCCAAAELASSVPLRPHLSCRQILRAGFPGVVAIDHTEFDRRARAGWAAFLHREARGCTGQPPPPWWASASRGELERPRRSQVSSALAAPAPSVRLLWRAAGRGGHQRRFLCLTGIQESGFKALDCWVHGSTMMAV